MVAFQEASAEQNGVVGENGVEDQKKSDELIVNWRFHDHRSFAGFSFVPGSAQANIGMRFHEGDLGRQSLREGNVVRIHAGDILASCQIQPTVERGDKPQILSVGFYPNTRVVERFRDFKTSVGRAVIDYQQFEIFKILIQDAEYGGSEIGSAIEDGHQYGDSGQLHRRRVTLSWNI